MLARKSDVAHKLYGKKDFYNVEVVHHGNDSDDEEEDGDLSDESMEDVQNTDYGAEDDLSNEEMKDTEVYDFFKQFALKNQSAKAKRLKAVEKGNKYLEAPEEDDEEDTSKYRKFFSSSKGDDDDYGDLGFKSTPNNESYIERMAKKLLKKEEVVTKEEEVEEKAEARNRIVLIWLARDNNLPGFFSLLPSEYATKYFPFHVMTRNTFNTENENLKTLLQNDVILVSFVLPLVYCLMDIIDKHIMVVIKSNIENTILPEKELLTHMIKLKQAKAIASILKEKGLFNIQYLFEYEQFLINKLKIKPPQLRKITDMQIMLKDMFK